MTDILYPSKSRRFMSEVAGVRRYHLQHLDSADEAVLISDGARREATYQLRAGPVFLSLDRPLAQCREYGRKVRHHRVVGAFVNFHVAHAVK